MSISVVSFYKGDCSICGEPVGETNQAIQYEDEKYACLDCHMKTKYRPWGDRLLVKRLDRIKQIGKIAMPGKVQQRSEIATILGIGDKVDPTFKVGMNIVFTFYSGTHLQLEETYTKSDVYRVITDREILLVYEE